jgi:hypothetical protein
MRVLLYNAQSHRYFQAPKAWTADPALAHNFGVTVMAVNTACEERLGKIEIVLDFEDSHIKGMRLPLRVSGCA